MDIYWVAVASSYFHWKYNGKRIKKTSKYPEDIVQNCLPVTNQKLLLNIKVTFFVMDLTLMTEKNKNLNVMRTTASSPQKPNLSGEVIRWELREESLTWFPVGGKLTLAIMNRAGRDIWMSSLPPETHPIWHCVIIMSGKSHELGLCYHKESSTGLLHISGAKKKNRKEKNELKDERLFLTAQKAVSKAAVFPLVFNIIFK